MTQESDWFKLEEAFLQMKPYSDIEMACTATVSPNGLNLAGRYGASMLSLAATSPVGVELLAGHWEIATAIAAENGQTSPARTGVSSGSCTSPRPRRKRAGSASTA